MAYLYFLNFLQSTVLLLRRAKMTSKHYFKRKINETIGFTVKLRKFKLQGPSLFVLVVLYHLGERGPQTVRASGP